MSNIFRNTALAMALVSVTGAASAAGQGSQAGFRNPLSIRMLADSSGAQAFMGTVEFKITNNSSVVLKVPYWQLPSASEEGKLFQVFHNGKAAEYLGPMIKRPAPTEADMVTFQPYETKLVTVDLSKSYDLSKGGDYTVSFVSYLQGAKTGTGNSLTASNGRTAFLQSVPLKLWVDPSNKLNSLKASTASSARGGTTTQVLDGVTYAGCSASQITDAAAGLAQARTYTENAKGYVNVGSATARYTTWFGAYTSGRYGTVKDHFLAIDPAMDQVSNSLAVVQSTTGTPGVGIKINCGCKKNYYAYVYPNKSYEIFVCNVFWTANTSGTDSKAGTLIHEMSHFTVVAGTDDWVYGQSGAQSLAISDPDKAIDNADSHEYFSENSPSQN